jgi:hypothetical protein
MVGLPVLRRDVVRPRAVLAGFFAAVLLLAFVPQPHVSANEYVVTNNYPSVSAEGSLHWAIAQANANPGHDTITFDMASIGTSWILFDGLCGDYVGDLGELLITEDVTIVGPGSELLSIEQRPYACDPALTRIIHINGASEVNISGLRFRQGRTADGVAGADSGHGAAIFNETANLTLTDCIFANNFVGTGGNSLDGNAGDGGSGGAVYCSAGTLTITDCEFDNNKAGRGGDSGSEDDSTAGTGAGEGGDGGAIYYLGGASLVIEDTTFNMSFAGSGGWLEYCVDGSSAGRGGSGGALYANSCTSVVVTDCVFQYSFSGTGGGQSYEVEPEAPEPGVGSGRNGLGANAGDGGALCVVDTHLTISGSRLQSNDASQGGESLTAQAGGGGHGGALFVLGGGCDATDCEFEYNSAGQGGCGTGSLVGASGHGGAIHGSCADVTLAGCTVRNNEGGLGWGDYPWGSLEVAESLPGAAVGGSGGGVYVTGGLLTLTECLFEENYAGMGGYSESAAEWSDPGSGGAVWCSNSGGDALDADSCAFVYNGGAKLGGAIYVNAGGAQMVNCTIAENRAREGGGIRAADDVPVWLSFCTVAWNEATSYGGGIYATSLALRGCIVGNNTFSTFDGAEPAQGTDDDGPDIYDGDGDVSFYHVTSHGGNVIGISSGFTIQQVDPSPHDAIDTEVGLGTLTNAFDPLYVCTLLKDSPALDFVPVADGTAIGGTAVDVDEIGSSRPLDGNLDGTALWDSGAYESSVQTTTVASATGTGDITIQNSGAGIFDEVDAVDTEDVCCDVPEGFFFPHGLLEIVIMGLPDEGNSPAEVTLTLIYPDDIPAGSMYWKCDNDTCEWIDVTDLLGDNDGDNVLTLTLTDGGDGDMDGVWDGEIHDPGGVVLAVEEEPEDKETAVERKRQETPPEPADMNTSYLALGTYQALPGQGIQVSVNVCNSGEVKGSQSVVLSVNGVAEQAQSVAVSGGSCKTVVFTVAKVVPGTYDIDVNGQHAQLTVVAPRLVQASVPSTRDTGVGTVGIIAILAVMAALIAGLVVVFKR